MKRKEIVLKIDEMLSATIAQGILDAVNGMDAEDSLSVLNGLTISMAAYASSMKEHAASHTHENALELSILDWLTRIEDKLGLHFSPYINIPKPSNQEEQCLN